MASLIRKSPVDTYSPISLIALGLQPGLSVLTLGNTHELDHLIATKVCQKALLESPRIDTAYAFGQENVAKSVVHITDIESSSIEAIQGTFDRIFCRLIFSQLPLVTANTILDSLLNKLVSGGRLVLEEIHSFDNEKDPKGTGENVRHFFENKRLKVTYNLPQGSTHTVAVLSLIKYY